MKTVEFKNIEDCKKYYNEKTNTYEFVNGKKRFSVEFLFDFAETANIYAENIIGKNIRCYNINCIGLKADNVDAFFC